jgi:hypothetical protein
MSFPPGTEMFQFPGFASRAYGFSSRYPLARVGCPIRRSPDQSLLAAPRGLSQRATSFIASWRQGIHQMPLLSSTPTSDNRTLAPHPSLRLGGGPARASARRSRRREEKDAGRRPCGRSSNNLQKAYPCFADARPRRKKAGVRPCLPAPARATMHRRPKTGLDARERAVITTSRCERSGHRCRWRVAPPFEARARLARVRQAGKGFPHGFRGPDGQATCRSAAPQRAGGAMVGLGRLERPTSRLSGVRSNQLSYRPESHPKDRAGPASGPAPARGGLRAGAGDPSVARCEGTCRRR